MKPTAPKITSESSTADLKTLADCPALRAFLASQPDQPSLKMLEAHAAAIMMLPYSENAIYAFEDYSDGYVMNNFRSMYWESATAALAGVLVKLPSPGWARIERGDDRVRIFHPDKHELYCQIGCDLE